MKDILTWLGEGVAQAAPDRHKVEIRTDAKGVTTAWCRLDDPADLTMVATRLAARTARLSAATAFPGRAGGHEIAWLFDLDGDSLVVSLELPADQALASLTALFPAADWPERDMAQRDGVRLAGHPHPDPLYLEETAVPDGYRPLSAWLASSDGRRRPSLRLAEPLYCAHRLTDGRLHDLQLRLARPHRQTGRLAGERNIHQGLALVERICAHSGNSHAFAYCAALEQIGGFVLPERAEHIRVIADELKRASAHFFCLAATARRARLEPLALHFLEAREVLLAVTEALFGNRVTLAVNRIGGVAADLDPGLVAWLGERLAELTEDALPPLSRALGFTGNFAGRTRGVGRLDAAAATRLGLVGPAARAAGVAGDVRRQAPYAVYDQLDFEVVTHAEGDVWARSLVRLKEAGQSLAIIAQCLAALPDGPVALDELPDVPAGEAIAKCESPEGELVYYLRTDGSERPQRLHWRAAAYNNWRALPELLEGAAPQDLPLIAGSLGPCIEG